MNPEDLDPFSAQQSPQTLRVISPAKSAVLVIDVLNDFVEPDGAMPLPGAKALYDPINRLTAAARTAGAAVVWVCAEYDPDDRLFEKRVPHCLVGTRGAEIPAELVREPADRVQHKRRYSAFFGTDLDLWLREHAIEQVVLCGLVTNICVRSTAHDAFFHGYDVVIARDACMATGPREEASSLYDLATHYATISDVEAVRAGWRTA